MKKIITCLLAMLGLTSACGHAKEQREQSQMSSSEAQQNFKTDEFKTKSGKTVKMRQKPTTKCSMYDDVPIGATVTLDEYGSDWSKISYGRRKGWYMMSKFLKVNS